MTDDYCLEFSFKHRGYEKQPVMLEYISIANIHMKPKSVMIKRGEEFEHLDNTQVQYTPENKKLLIKKTNLNLL